MISPTAEQLPFRTLLYRPLTTPVTAGLFVLRTEDEWLSAGKSWTRDLEPAPVVDWAGELVVVLSAGARADSSYQVTIARLAVRDRRLYVRARENKSEAALHLVMYPLHAVAAPRRDFGDDPRLVRSVIVRTGED